MRRREIGEVEDAVLGEVGIEHDVVQSLRRRRLDRRHSSHRRRHRTVVGADDSHRAAVLRHEQGAVGKKRKRPRASESTGHGLHSDRR